MKKSLFIVMGVVAVACSVVWAYSEYGRRNRVQFRTVPVTRGDLQVTISATGTVEPEEVVDVGAQIAGMIKSFGKDPHKSDAVIDYGSEVDEGTVLALIDDSLYAAQVASASALLEQAKANVFRAQADRDSKIAAQAQASAGVDLALITYNHLKNIPPASESHIEVQNAEATLKQAQSALETAKANVAVSEATLVQAQSTVAQQDAEVNRTKINLEYCTIRSPVKGVIIDRRVNIGQTVVASLNAPSLFLIAKDLKRMQVWASVNEADIGNIHAGQAARFTVDAHPGRTFTGEVGKIRLNATMTQNVVTYTVEVDTENPDGALLPYLTANVQFQVAELKNVLLVPNAALRWSPPASAIAPESQMKPSHATTEASKSGKGHRVQESVWVLDNRFVRPVTVRVGPSDGSQTQIEANGIEGGTEVAVGLAANGAVGGAATTNPFTPQMFGNRRQQ